MAKTLFEIFNSKHIKRGKVDCWIWVGATAGGEPNAQYGHMNYKKKSLYAHRVSWILYNGAIPKGICVLHSCDEPLCVNPWHLFLGTQTDNMEDRDRKGRGKGVTITCKDTDTIYTLYRNGICTQAQLARMYGVGQNRISQVLNL